MLQETVTTLPPSTANALLNSSPGSALPSDVILSEITTSATPTIGANESAPRHRTRTWQCFTMPRISLFLRYMRTLGGGSDERCGEHHRAMASDLMLDIPGLETSIPAGATDRNRLEHATEQAPTGQPAATLIVCITLRKFIPAPLMPVVG